MSQLSVTQLRSMLKEQPLIIDVREADEYQVSHLPGAQLAATVRLETVGRDRLIVAYCSVGLRSAEYVEHLQQQGFQKAFNLRGSIFSWANEGYPLEAAGRSTREMSVGPSPAQLTTGSPRKTSPRCEATGLNP